MSNPLNTMTYLSTTPGSTVAESGNLPVVGQGIYNRVLLERAQPNLMHAYFGQQKSVARRNGLSLVFRRYNSLGQATVELGEGVTPPPQRGTKTDYTVTLKQFGGWTAVSDVVDTFHVDSVITEYSQLMGEQMGESLDSIIREVLVGGTSLYRVQVDDGGTYELDAARDQVGGVLCKTVCDSVVRDLKGQNAKTFVPEIPASVKVNTHPLPEAFWCLIHTDQETDFYRARSGFYNSTTKAVEGFIPVQNYAGNVGVMKNEVGAYRNIRFVTSTNTKIWTDTGLATSGGGAGLKSSGTKADVYAALFFSRDAYAVAKPDASMSRIIVTKAGGPGDPLEQRNTVGWKAMVASVILNQNFLVRVEVGTCV